jgi:hypothetical protein
VPIADQIQSGTYLLYDGACGTGGMLTVAEETLNELAGQHGKRVSTHLFGQEINGETYAIAKADLLLKGEGEEADNIVRLCKAARIDQPGLYGVAAVAPRQRQVLRIRAQISCVPRRIANKGQGHRRGLLAPLYR